MSNFEEVCLLSCEKWVDSFPDEIPIHKFSKIHKEKMKELFQTEPAPKLKLSKKTAKLLLIAAILLALTTTTVFAIPGSRKAILEKFSNHDEYVVLDTSKAKKVKSLIVNYMPDGYECVEKIENKEKFTYHFENGGKRIQISKKMLGFGNYYDNEHGGTEEIKINGYDGLIYDFGDSFYGIVFNDGNYIFEIISNENKETIVKIAQNIE